MKKLFALLLAAVIIMSLASIPAGAAAAEFVVDGGTLLRYNGSSAVVNVPDGVVSIGPSAFEGNSKVQKVILPSTLSSIGDRAFYGCSMLRSVSGGSVSSVGVFSFNGTPYLDESTDEFLMLGSCLLWYNGSASNVLLPNGTVSIAPYAFLDCDSLNAVAAYTGLVSVGEGAFCYCDNLSAVSLPASVTYIGAAAFEGTAFLNGITGFGILGDGVLIRYAGASTSVNVPDGVRRIAAGAFYNNKSVTGVSVPASVFSIDRSAFEGCTKLRTLEITCGLVYIGSRAFAECTALENLVTPATLSYIGEGAFEGCISLDWAQIDGTELTIASGAFSGCCMMKYVLLSDGVEGIGDRAFSGCSALEAVSIPRGVQSFGSDIIKDSESTVIYCFRDSAAASALKGYDVSYLMGDVDNDGRMTIIDATRVQRMLAGMIGLNARGMCVSDMDGDADVSALDVTRIQLLLAGFE